MKLLNVSQPQRQIQQGLTLHVLAAVAKRFMDAAGLYGQALEQNPTDPTVWLNRAFTRMNLVSGVCSISAERPI